MNDKETILRNFEGKLVSYPEPTWKEYYEISMGRRWI
jgi:hypothetical protein